MSNESNAPEESAAKVTPRRHMLDKWPVELTVRVKPQAVEVTNRQARTVDVLVEIETPGGIAAIREMIPHGKVRLFPYGDVIRCGTQVIVQGHCVESRQCVHRTGHSGACEVSISATS